MNHPLIAAHRTLARHRRAFLPLLALRADAILAWAVILIAFGRLPFFKISPWIQVYAGEFSTREWTWVGQWQWGGFFRWQHELFVYCAELANGPVPVSFLASASVLAPAMLLWHHLPGSGRSSRPRPHRTAALERALLVAGAAAAIFSAAIALGALDQFLGWRIVRATPRLLCGVVVPATTGAVLLWSPLQRYARPGTEARSLVTLAGATAVAAILFNSPWLAKGAGLDSRATRSMAFLWPLVGVIWVLVAGLGIPGRARHAAATLRRALPWLAVVMAAQAALVSAAGFLQPVTLGPIQDSSGDWGGGFAIGGFLGVIAIDGVRIWLGLVTIGAIALQARVCSRREVRMAAP